MGLAASPVLAHPMPDLTGLAVESNADLGLRRLALRTQ
jgi:hypothetical protein